MLQTYLEGSLRKRPMRQVFKLRDYGLVKEGLSDFWELEGAAVLPGVV